MELIGLKTRMQSYGVKAAGLSSRDGGAGPADGTTLFIGDLAVNVPTRGGFVDRSPYSIEERGEEFLLLEDGAEVARVEPAGEPGFYELETPGGVSFRKVALRHGRDAIGTTVMQACSHTVPCAFCAIEASNVSGATLPEKTPEELALVSRSAWEEGYRHFVLTTGTTAEPDRGIARLSGCAAAVKSNCDMKVHLQFEPPDSPEWIEEAGRNTDSCAINIETFDPDVRASMTPGKAGTSLDEYLSAWKKAVDVFGAGNVTCFILAGLGESDDSIEEGARLLASLGVYPFLLPLRPLRGTRLQDREPPASDRMMRLYERCAGPVTDAGLKASDCPAGCVRCAACSAFPDITG